MPASFTSASATSDRRLRLRVVADTGRHDDLGGEPVADPSGLGGRVLPVHVVAAHHHDGGGADLVEASLGRCVRGVRRLHERLPVTRTSQVLGDGGGVLVVPLGAGPGCPLRVEAHERLRTPRLEQRQPEHQRGDRASGWVAHERPDQDEPEHRIRSVRGGEDRGARAHRVAHEVRRAAELVDQRESVRGQRLVVVRGEGGIGVAVAAKVEGGNPEAGVDEERGQVAVRRPQLAHRGQADDQRALARDVVGDPALGPLEHLASSHSHKARGISQGRQAGPDGRVARKLRCPIRPGRPTA